MFDELHVLPIDPDNQKKVGHDYETAGFTGPDRGECIVEGCKAKPHTICWSCSKDTINMFLLNQMKKFVKEIFVLPCLMEQKYVDRNGICM